MVLAHSRPCSCNRPQMPNSSCALHCGGVRGLRRCPRQAGGRKPNKQTDNLQYTAVTRPDLYDPDQQGLRPELAAHFGCLIDPARAGKPKDKPLVERPMQYVRTRSWAGPGVSARYNRCSAAVGWSREWADAKSRPWTRATLFVFSPLSNTPCWRCPRTEFKLWRCVFLQGRHRTVHVRSQCAYSVRAADGQPSMPALRRRFVSDRARGDAWPPT